jgi:hypothetical protein
LYNLITLTERERERERERESDKERKEFCLKTCCNGCEIQKEELRESLLLFSSSFLFISATRESLRETRDSKKRKRRKLERWVAIMADTCTRGDYSVKNYERRG